MIRALIVAAVVLTSLAGTTAAQASGPKDACKDGGYVEFIDPATGSAFTSQGACVSFVARGGTLVPVSRLVVTIVEIPDGVVGDYRMLIEISGLVPDAPFQMHLATRSGGEVWMQGLVAYSDGTYPFPYESDCRDENIYTGDVVVVQGDATVVTPVPEITECPVVGDAAA